MTALDATAAKFWDAESGTWITPSRGLKGPTGPVGAAGPNTGVMPKSAFHRRLSPGETIPINWWDYTFDSVPQAKEINNMISIIPATNGFRVAKTGAYFFHSNTWYNTGNTPGKLWAQALNRLAFDGGVYEIARTAVGQGGSATSLSMPFLASMSDYFKLANYQTSGPMTHNSDVLITYLGPCRVREWDYAVMIDHVDVTYGLTPGTTYTLTPRPAQTLPGDWIYLVHTHWWESPDVIPAIPQGFEPVVPSQTSRTPGSNGICWTIWRKKYVAGDSYIVNMAATRYLHSTAITVRQPNDDLPVLSPLVAPRQGLPATAVTVPGGVVGSSGLAIQIVDTGGPNVTPPPSVSAPGTYWFSIPPEGPGPAASRTELAIAQLGPNLANSNPITFTWPGNIPDVGWVGGITLSWPRVAL